MIKKIIITGILMLIVLISVSFVSAEFWLCMNKGEKISYCNNYKPDWICPDEVGCEMCMSVYRENENCYIHGVWPRCNAGPKECGLGGDHNVDGNAPEFNLISPQENGLYTSRSVLVEFDLNEESDVYYYDNINGRGRWTRVCRDCSPGNPAYSKGRSFKEGFNDLTFKAGDGMGNEVLIDRSFFVDSKKPKIMRTEPRRGFADGEFEIRFSEENPENLFLNYGNSITGYYTKELDIDTECYIEKKRYYCSIDVKEDPDDDFTDYNGQRIEYWFELKDIAGNLVQSKHVWLEADTSFPVLNNDNILPNEPDSFWEQGQGRDSKYIYFKFNVTDENFDEINYLDNLDINPRWRRLCSRLKDGICEKKKTFRKGHHNLNIQIIDEAGNSIGSSIEFNVDY